MTTRIMGRYEVVGLLGSGGIGQVYAARDQALGRTVAIKALRPEYSSDRSFLERFHAEAASLARLSHQNIATLYDLQVDGQQLYMIMELVRGHTLEAVLARTRRLGVRESLAITAQTIAGLGYAHQMGVIHRDIKPSNLMLTDSGALKIMDFGIARVRGSQRLTRTGNIVGTLAYVAPEQIKGGEGDERSDLYSLACVLYEMLAGDPPFNAATEYELIRAQVDTSPQTLKVRLPDIPAALDEALMRALVKDPHERFASVAEFGHALGADEVSTHAIDIIHHDVLATIGPSVGPELVADPIPMLTPNTNGVGRQSSSLPPRSRNLLKGVIRMPAFIRQFGFGAPVAVLGGAITLLVLVFGYIVVNSGSPNPQISQTNVRSMATASTSELGQSQQQSAQTVPPSPFILPPPGSSANGQAPAANVRPRSVVPTSAPLSSAEASSIPLPHADESPAYIGRVVDWPGPNLIAVPMGGAFGLKFLKLYGILDASSGQTQADDDHQKMKNFLAAAGNKIVCYARGEATFQCYANRRDIALWAVKNGLAKPAPDAPREYLEGQD
ncbi:MAG: serine/threonine protein kinase [Alphaproteobacteria bacterium]|nr:serine/threonine protein kinase [Alphaproteobacteria bacterium]